MNFQMGIPLLLVINNLDAQRLFLDQKNYLIEISLLFMTMLSNLS